MRRYSPFVGVMLDTSSRDPAEAFEGLHFDAVAAYGNGTYENDSAAKNTFGHLHLLEIDVRNANIGNAGDFETGDMAYSEAGNGRRSGSGPG